MGIRFCCHLCGTELNVKEFQGGRRGRCPSCRGAFRIPLKDAKTSLAVHARPEDISATEAEENLATENFVIDEEPLGDESSDPFDLAPIPGLSTDQSVALPPIPAPPPWQPRAILESPHGQWFVRAISGEQFGPATGHSIWHWLLEKRVNPNSLVWQEGWPQWKPAAEVFDDFFKQSTHGVNLPVLHAPQKPVPNQPPPIAPLNSWAPAASGSSQSQPTPAGAAKLQSRRQRSRRNYQIVIVTLVALFLGLLACLIIVLWYQSKPKPQSDSAVAQRPYSARLPNNRDIRQYC